MGLSEIRNDEQLFNSLTTQQREIFQTAYACSSVMNRICTKSLQAMFPTNDQAGSSNHHMKEDPENDNNAVKMTNVLRISELVKHLHVVMDPFPKQVPIVITVDDAIPPTVVGDELKVFRSVVNYLTNACACTDTGSVHLKIFLKDADIDIGEERRIVFLVEDTGPGVSVAVLILPLVFFFVYFTFWSFSEFNILVHKSCRCFRFLSTSTQTCSNPSAVRSMFSHAN